MEIQEFVKISDIDPLYFNTSYYAVPEEPGRKAYQLLVETMQKSGYAAIAKVGMHEREYVVVIRPRDKGLTLHSIYFPNEVRAVPEYGSTRDVEIRPQEVKLAEQLIQSLAGPFEPQRYHDEYQQRLLEMVKAKAAGKHLAPTPQKKPAPVIDLMQALQKSLAGVQKKPAAKAAAPRKAHAPRRTALKTAHR
jgi:DNA end-binding protein Ku